MPRRDSRPQRRRHAAPAAVVFTARGCLTPRWFRSVAAWAAVTCLLAAAAPATALQVLDARDGVAVEAVLSIKEPTRIRIDGAPITDVFGNIHSSNCSPAAPSSSGSSGAPPAAALPAVNPTGEIVLECDRDKGEIYIRPVGDSPKPVNLFISSAHATYTLVLRKADTPADTIVIRDPGQRALQAMQSPTGAAGSQTPLVTAPEDAAPGDGVRPRAGRHPCGRAQPAHPALGGSQVLADAPLRGPGSGG
jgi:conjugal transfer pilus assembly protein TraK